MKQHILFDLDGTLTDSGLGITRSVSYALEKLGLPALSQAQLETFVGPPLDVGFRQFFPITDEDVARAMTYFREYYHDTGIFENEVYAGMPKLLAGLKDAGRTLHVATSKPTVFAKRILEHFDIAKCFGAVEGSDLNHVGHAKADIIAAVLQAQNISTQDAIMVGDRKYDILGATEHGMSSVGVLFGYGSRQELTNANATYIAESVQELGEILIKI